MNFFKMIKLGGEAGMNKCPKINEIPAKWAENDEIIIDKLIEFGYDKSNVIVKDKN